jgi:hypothetical protein
MESTIGCRNLVTVTAVLLVVVGDFCFGMFGTSRCIPALSDVSHTTFKTASKCSSVSHGLAKRISTALLVALVLVAALLVAGKLLVYRRRCWCSIPADVAEKEAKALSALKHGDILQGNAFLVL